MSTASTESMSLRHAFDFDQLAAVAGINLAGVIVWAVGATPIPAILGFIATLGYGAFQVWKAYVDRDRYHRDTIIRDRDRRILELERQLNRKGKHRKVDPDADTVDMPTPKLPE